MNYPSYLIHYNKNHSKANGQFVSGDGDGDGISNDHKNQVKPNKYQNADGSLTEKGHKKFDKLISLKKQYDEQTKRTVEAANEQYKYLKKNKFLSKDPGAYKTDTQLAYATDEKFKQIVDKTLNESNKQKEVYDLFARERSKIAGSNYNAFILVGQDMVNQVLKYNV